MSAAVASTPVGTARRLGVTLVGPVVWATHLLVAYLGGALLCHRGRRVVPFIATVTLIAAVLVAIALVASIRRAAAAARIGPEAPGDCARHDERRRREREDDRFLGHVATGLNALYLVTIVLAGVWAVIVWC